MVEISHHDALFNLREIAKQLILLEQHYVEDPCADCIAKHLLTVEALAQEGLNLNNAEKYQLLLKEALDLAQKHYDIVQGFLFNQNGNYNLLEMAQEVRQLRKKIMQQAFNVNETEHILQQIGVKKDQWNWEQVKPKTPSQRQEIFEKYGAACFLRPSDLGFPICNIYGQIDCDGLRAAYVRAKAAKSAAEKVGKLDLAREYEEIANKALNIAKSVGCLWVK